MRKRRHPLRDAAEHWKSRRKRLRLECRECEVICERVVSPWRCLKDSCRYIYVYEDSDTSYFGCMQKVFSPELDLAAFAGAQSGRGRGADPYGSLRVARSPRPECHTTVEQAYSSLSGRVMCCNPTFFHHPAGRADESIRLTINNLPGTDPVCPDS
jgi:hypothetical protein